LNVQLGYLVGSLEINVVGGWRYMYGLSAPVSVAMAIGMFLLPSSPRWILLRAIQGKGPMEESKQMATNALRKLRGQLAGDRASEKEVEDTLASLKSAYSDQEPEGSIWEVFEGPSLKAFIIGGGLVLFQQVAPLPSPD
jgi:MFS family permease